MQLVPKPIAKFDLKTGSAADLVAQIPPQTLIVTLTGATGVGKSTRFPYALTQAGQRVLVVTASKIAEQVLSQYMDNTTVIYEHLTESYRRLSTERTLVDVDWLIIDDIQLGKLEMSLLIVVWQHLYINKAITARLALVGLSVPDTFLDLIILNNSSMLTQLVMDSATYSIDVQYTEINVNPKNYPAVIKAYLNNLQPVLTGNVLIILPTETDVNNVAAHLTEYKLVTITSDMFLENYRLLWRNLDAIGDFKVIIATPVVEVALTIPGLQLVIDSMHVSSYITRPNGAQSYQVENAWISKEQARQRAGRAGRTQEGICLRLCTLSSFNALPERSPVELTVCDFGPLYLQLRLLGYPTDLLPVRYSTIVNRRIDQLGLTTNTGNNSIASLVTKLPLSLFPGSLLARWIEAQYPITAGVIFAALIEVGGPYLYGSIADVKYTLDSDNAVIIDPNDSSFDIYPYAGASDFDFICRLLAVFAFPKLLKSYNVRINFDLLRQLLKLVQIIATRLIDLSLITDVSSLEDNSYFSLDNIQLLESIPYLQLLIKQYYPQLIFKFQNMDQNYVSSSGDLLYLNRTYPRKSTPEVLACLVTDGDSLIELCLHL